MEVFGLKPIFFCQNARLNISPFLNVMFDKLQTFKDGLIMLGGTVSLD